MLVLTRKKDESVVIDGKIVIRILSVQNGRVRVGIEAPDEVVILREEVPTRRDFTTPNTKALSERVAVQ